MRFLIRRVLFFGLVLAVLGCTVKAPFPAYTFEEMEIRKPDSRMLFWLYGDLNGDNRDEMIYATASLPGMSHLMINDYNLKPISQINSQFPFRTAKILKHPGTGQSWLFYSYNDSRKVYLNAALYEWVEPLKRSDYSFEPILRDDPWMDNPSIEWYAMIDPLEIVDLDQDGRYELVCRAVDSYTANPRGVVVYDLETKAIKWQLSLTTNPSSVICRDFTGNGRLELLISTEAVKNTRESRNGIDDSNGWLLLVDADGEILHTEFVFEGYGRIYLAAREGETGIYKLESTWGNSEHVNSVEKISWREGKFHTLQRFEAKSNLNRIQDYFLRELEDGQIRLFVPSRNHGLIILDEDLNEIEHEFVENVFAVYAWGKASGRAEQDVLVQTEDGVFYLLDLDGRILASMPSPFPDEQRSMGRFFATGKSDKLSVTIISPMQIRIYQIRHLSIVNTFIGYIRHFRKLVNVVVILIVVLLSVYLYQLRAFYTHAQNYWQCGLIQMLNERRIIKMNHYVKLLIGTLELDETSRRLDIIFPDLYKHLLAFKRGLNVPYRTKVEFGTPSGVQYFDLVVLKSHGLLCRYLLILNPVCELTKELDEKLAWAELARRLSHHVRRHIANILLALGPLEKDLKEESTNREYLDLLKTEINQIKTFTHSFQRFTELKDYQLKAQDLIPSLEHVLSRITIPRNVMLERDWTLKSIHAHIEPIRFEEALTNLITNALDAMPEGGTLQISVREFPLHEVNHEGRSVLIEIEDTGCGIPEKYRDEIWQPFFTTKQSGTGIGLPESRKIIESMHGTIEFQSEVGVGTIVSIWLKGTDNG